MPRPLTISLDGEEFEVLLAKVDRSGLYGDVAIEAFDERGNPAEMMVLAQDGKTLIARGGTALEMVNKSGDSIDREDIRPVDKEGNKIEPIPSSFKHVNVLKSAEIEDYLSLIVKSIYWLDPVEKGKMDVLLENLGDGRLFSFPFSYRDGIESDEAFIVGSKTDAFMIVGDQATLKYLEFNQAVNLDAPEEQEISADDLDFDIL